MNATPSHCPCATCPGASCACGCNSAALSALPSACHCGATCRCDSGAAGCVCTR